MSKKIGFIGAGNMAEALMRGVISKGLYTEDEIIASEIYEPRRKKVSKELGVDVVADNEDVIKAASLIILAIKPQQVGDVLSSLNSILTKKHVLVSIAAGVTIKTLETYAPNCRIIRVMPNQPCMVMASATAFSCGDGVSDAERRIVSGIFNAVGVAVEVKEDLLDAVTGLSGSGPAYAYLVIEGMSDGGVLMGLPRDISIKLAAQTLMGAAKTILETGEHPGRMKDIVCSPGGTTIEAIRVLEDYGVRAAMINAVEASASRSKELGK